MRLRAALSLVAGLVAVSVLGSGCGRSPAPPVDDDQLLVFTLGGEAPTLRSRLGMRPLKRSDVFGEERPKIQRPRVTPKQEPGPGVRGQIQSLPPAPEREFPATAKLRSGETIVGLCKRVLGDGNRWAEVLKLNGWTERDARRLGRGTVVKLPAR